MRFISQSLSDSDSLYEHVNFSTKPISNLREIVTITSRGVWSPIVWRDGIRKTENFVFSDYLVLDFDSSMQLPEALDSFKDYQCFISTTLNHQKRKNGHISDRFRVVIPWEKRIESLNLYRGNMQHKTNYYESDSDCVDGGRLYKRSPHVVFYNEGEPMEVLNISPKEHSLANIIPMEPPCIMPGWLQNLINRGADGEEGRNSAGFKIAAAMFRQGYRENEVLYGLKKSYGIENLSDSELKRIINNAKKSTSINRASF